MIQGVDKYLTQDVKVYRPTSTIDEYGSPVVVNTLVTTIKGRLRQLSENERLSAQKVEHYGTHRLYTLENIIQNEDYIEYQLQKFNVIGVNNVMNFNEFYQIELELRE